MQSTVSVPSAVRRCISAPEDRGIQFLPLYFCDFTTRCCVLGCEGHPLHISIIRASWPAPFVLLYVIFYLSCSLQPATDFANALFAMWLNAASRASHDSPW